ncbi:MAG: tetratricopeptide repeat protein [Deltaproteobacteria bacterium]|nr:tetratricopeptide repeat protein [Deltaproteobacteria bacterium]
MNHRITNPPASGMPRSPIPHLGLIVGLALALFTLAAFWQVRHHDFVNYDDYEYVVQNPHVRYGITPRGLVWAFTSFHSGNWHPLTWISHMVDCELFGLNPGAHHFTGLLLHVASSLLLCRVLFRMTGALWRSVLVAVLFAVHPLHVESVAWVAERKDVLSTLFWMLTIWAYHRYVDGPRAGRYLLTLLFFTLGLMAKPMLVTLPFVLLLLDYWPLGRAVPGARRSGSPWPSLIREKAPFFALSLASCVVTLLAQIQWEAMLLPVSFPDRAANALVSYAAYMVKTVWPQPLAVFYPHPGDGLAATQVGGSILLLACVSLLALGLLRRHPYLLVGWLWYLGTLVPVIGLVQVGAQGMADRYTYVPLIGLFVMFSWSMERLASWNPRARAGVLLVCGLITAALFLRTLFQVPYWKNGVTLFEHAIRVTRDTSLIRNNLGNALARQGRIAEAEMNYREALRIGPDVAAVHNNLGNVLLEQGRLKEAVEHYRWALEIRPDFPPARENLERAMQKIKGEEP